MKKAKYIIILSVVVISAPFLVSSQTVADLLAQIDALMQKVQELQAQLKAQQGGGGTAWCHTFNQNLSIGSRGPEVTALVTALLKSGFDTGIASTDPSLVFDERIASVVSGFQEKYKSEVLTPVGLNYGTGFVGPSTRKKLNQLYGCGLIQPSTLPTIYPTPYPSINPAADYKNADFIIAGLEISPNNPTAYQISKLKFSIKNIGSEEAPFAWKTFGPATSSVAPDDANTTCFFKTKSNFLGAGELCTVSFIVTHYGAGPNKIEAVAYLDSQYSESNISNNNVVINYNVTASTSGIFKVVSPNGGEVFTQGSILNIHWYSTNTTSTLLLEIRKGGSPYVMINSAASNIGYYSWPIPTTFLTGNDYKIRVTDQYDRSVYDESDVSFSIVSSGTATTTQPAITITSPNGGEALKEGETHTIRWTTPQANSMVMLDLYPWGYPEWAGSLIEGNVEPSRIGVSAPGATSFNWAVPYGIADLFQKAGIPKPTSYGIRAIISEPNSGNISLNNAMDYSDAPFTIASAPTSIITVTSPNGGETWVQGSMQNISWIGGDSAPIFDISLVDIYGNSIADPFGTIGRIDGIYHSLNWKVGSWLTQDSPACTPTTCPNTSAGQYRIKVCTGTNCDISDAPFTIASAPISVTTPYIKVLTPNTGQVSYSQPVNITWGASGVSSPITIKLRRSDGTITPIATVANTSRSYNWTPSQTGVYGTGYRIYLNGTATNGTELQDVTRTFELYTLTPTPSTTVINTQSTSTQVKITGTNIVPSPLTINAGSKTFTIYIQNDLGYTITNATIESRIIQLSTNRQARATLKPTCVVNGTPNVSGTVPPGQCGTASYAFAYDTADNPGAGTFVPGTAYLLLELKQNATVLSSITIPILLNSSTTATSTGSVLGSSSDAELQAMADTLANLRAILLEMLNSLQ